MKDKSIAAILNTHSGSCTPESADDMKAIFADAGLSLSRMWCVESAELAGAFAESKTCDIDVLVVLGGDGTIRSAAAGAQATGPVLIPLPGGTMNVLPKALYGSGSWEEVLTRILKDPVEKSISGGEVAGERFFISSIFGAPALWAEAREAIRAGDLGEAAHHGKIAFDQMFANKIQYRFNEMHEGTAEALVVTCPLVSSALENDRHVFEAAVFDVEHAIDVLGLATAAAFGTWREHEKVATVRTDHVTVSSEKALPVILDGETIEVGKEAEVNFVPDAFVALVPREDEILS
jgi:diacylglycerol kinase family enzyme